MKIQLAIALFASLLAALFTGCAMLDFDRNGRIDPIEYLSNADITVIWTDGEGNVYQMDIVELSGKLAFEYIRVKTGYHFEIAPKQDGTIGIKITDPNGYTVWIQPTAPE